MTEFLDGPAQGIKLMLRRAPHYLRAVTTGTGEWDALDQIADTPKPTEHVLAYEMVGEPSWLHVRADKGRGGMYHGGKYQLVNPQPSEAILRENKLWQDWALDQFEHRDEAEEEVHGTQ